MASCDSTRSMGRRRWAGACSGWPLGGGLSNWARAACTRLSRNRAWAPGRGHSTSPPPSICSAHRRNRPPPAGSCQSSWSICSRPLASDPCTPWACRPGTWASSQGRAAGCRQAHQALPARAVASNSTAASTPQASQRHADPTLTAAGGAVAWGGALVGGGVKRRSRRKSASAASSVHRPRPGPPAAGRWGCASGCRRRSPRRGCSRASRSRRGRRR